MRKHKQIKYNTNLKFKQYAILFIYFLNFFKKISF